MRYGGGVDEQLETPLAAEPLNDVFHGVLPTAWFYRLPPESRCKPDVLPQRGQDNTTQWTKDTLLCVRTTHSWSFRIL